MKENTFLLISLWLSLFLFLTNCKKNETEIINIDDRDIADENRVADWLAYGRTHNERRFSPLDDVGLVNVKDLKVDWYLDLPKDIGLVSTPLVVNGVLYFTGTMNIIRAVDAASGRLLWEFDPEVGKHIEHRRQVGFITGESLFMVTKCLEQPGMAGYLPWMQDPERRSGQ